MLLFIVTQYLMSMRSVYCCVNNIRQLFALVTNVCWRSCWIDPVNKKILHCFTSLNDLFSHSDVVLNIIIMEDNHNQNDPNLLTVDVMVSNRTRKIGTKWENSITFLDQFTSHFGWVSQNVLETEVKKSRRAKTY